MKRDDPKIALWLSVFGDTENGTSFSELLMGNPAFRDWAEQASTHTQLTREWFESIILGNNEDMFNKLCQDINERLLKFIIDTRQEKKSKKTLQGAARVSLYMKIIKMLETHNMDGLIASDTTNEVRMGVVAIVQVLNQEMNKRANTVLVAYEKEQRKQKNKTLEERLNSRDVNKIFGWSIYHLRKQKI